ncbi:MAG: hypothetical protein II864_07815 [Prevotella sp.]|nr:hypothetical protein [Prevotella sp.]
MTNLLQYITWNPAVEAFSVGSFSFRWYSLCWLLGLAIAYLVVKRLYKETTKDWGKSPREHNYTLINHRDNIIYLKLTYNYTTEKK